MSTIFFTKIEKIAYTRASKKIR